MNNRGALSYFVISLIAIFLIAGLIFTNYAYTGQVLEDDENASNYSDGDIADTQRIMNPPEKENATENTTAINETDSSTGSTSPDSGTGTGTTDFDETEDTTTDATETDNNDTGRGITSLPGDISSCQEIDYEGIYTLDRDLETTGSCFTITVNNTVIDCQGHSIIGDGSGAHRAIYADIKSNLTIKNCKISNFTYGIQMVIPQNSIIHNNTVNNSNYGIRLGDGADFAYYNNVTNNIIRNTSYSLDANYFFNGSISNNIIIDNGRGIYISNSKYNTLANNTLINNTNGLEIISTSNYNEIEENNISENQEKGIHMDDSDHNTLNKNGITNNSRGIYIISSDFNNIINNSIKNSNETGIEMISADNLLVQDNNFENNSKGIEIDSTDDNTISSNIFKDNYNYGIYLQQTYSNNISFNNFTDNSKNIEFIITTSNHCDNIIENNTGYMGRDIIYFNSTAASFSNKIINQLILCNAAGSSIDNITAIGNNNLENEGFRILDFTDGPSISNSESINHSVGLRIENSESCFIANTTFEGSKEYSMHISQGSHYAQLKNITIINPSSSYDLFINDSNETEIVDSRIEKYNFSTNPIEVIIENTTYGKIDFFGGINGTGNNLSSEVIIGNNSAFVDSESKPGLNSSANITLYGVRTDFNNPDILRNEFLCPGSVCQNYTSLNAGTVKFSVTGWTTYSIDETFTELTSCGPLNSADTIYKLKNPVNSTGTCFNILAENITLECKNWGNTIIYGNSSSTDTYYGIVSIAEGSTIQNCEIKMGSEATGALERYAIYSEGSNGTITNINASNNRQGIVLEGNASNNNVTDSIANNNEQTGIYIISNNGSRIINNTANNNKFGIRIYWESDKNIMANNTANDNSFAGFYLGPDADNNTVYSNNATGNAYGFALHSGEDNTFYSNSIVENDYGFYINSSNYTNVSLNTIEDNSIYGMKLS
ncbi:hypothetical protein GF378_01655, partial [Candidatus Pacearchaeota archaeon]|nr:hypothetical protein [Candidatus Pacearchaeota archaeon]